MVVSITGGIQCRTDTTVPVLGYVVPVLVYAVLSALHTSPLCSEFLVGLCVVNERGPHGRRDALRLAFEVRDNVSVFVHVHTNWTHVQARFLTLLPTNMQILDTDRMGSLDRNQFGRMIALLKPGLPCTSVDAVFIDAGASGDGSMLRLSAAQFITWGDAHGNESDLFRKTFLGFSSELSMLATETQQTAAMASTVG